MPIQINEVIIRTTVDTNDNGRPASGPALLPAEATVREKELILEIIEEFISDKNER